MNLIYPLSSAFYQYLNLPPPVSGVCRPGELLAVMGASGAGKTTLLNVLTHRNNDKVQAQPPQQWQVTGPPTATMTKFRPTHRNNDKVQAHPPQ